MDDATVLNKHQEQTFSGGPDSRLRRIIAIALNAFREAVRDRVLYNLVLFVLLLTAAAIFIGELSGGQERKVIVDLGLSAMLLFGAFIAIFVGVGLVYKEIEKRTIYAIFSKPVGRGEFLVGKYLGLCLTLLVNVLVMGLGVSLALIYVSRGWDPLVVVIWPAVLLIYLELMILTAIALLFSSFSSPARLRRNSSTCIKLIGSTYGFRNRIERANTGFLSSRARWPVNSNTTLFVRSNSSSTRASTRSRSASSGTKLA